MSYGRRVWDGGGQYCQILGGNPHAGLGFLLEHLSNFWCLLLSHSGPFNKCGNLLALCISFLDPFLKSGKELDAFIRSNLLVSESRSHPLVCHVSGIIPKEKSLEIKTVRIVKRESQLRQRERPARRASDDWQLPALAEAERWRRSTSLPRSGPWPSPSPDAVRRIPDFRHHLLKRLVDRVGALMPLPAFCSVCAVSVTKCTGNSI